jgi:putative transposase
VSRFRPDINTASLRGYRASRTNPCGYTTTRDVAASQEVRNRGIQAVGQVVLENVCGLDATGSIGHNILVGTGRSRKSKSQVLESPTIATLGA